MQFQSITITNLFSYYGKNSLKFKSNNKCNVTVLIGRNGYGKTSFINSIKLLFLDSFAEEVRRTVQRKRTPTPKQFVEGINNEWWGILNHRAKQQGKMSCSIAAEWIDDEGFGVSAKRSWDLSQSYESFLVVHHPMHGQLEDNKAEEFLENIMPKSYLPFFFFDGEEVQEIAEANDTEVVKKMELLLNIRPLENMQEALLSLATDWRKKGQSAAAKKELEDKEYEINSKNQHLASYQQEIDDLSLEIEEAEAQLKKLDRHLRWLRGGVSQEAEIKLKSRIENNEEQRDNLLSELASYWKNNAVLSVHPILLQKVLSKLETHIHSSQGDQQELLKVIRQRLDKLFSTPPFPSQKLTDKQSIFYNKRIIKEIDAINITETEENAYQITHETTKHLFNQLSQYKSNNIFKELRQKTVTAQSLWQSIHNDNNKLKSAGKLSQNKQLEYQQLLEQESQTKQNLINLEVRKANLQKESDILQRSINTLKGELKEKERALRVATEFRQQHNFALKLKDALDQVKRELKTLKRKELEEKYNEHLSALLDSHALVSKVQIDENFEISYLDNQGNTVGMSTISAGMKQLSATALLWALKDISGREFPIIIDTPMGRIDAKHQENLLKKYYPNVGRQVILLPTDSELDQRKYELLAPHICKRYQLDNPTGLATSITELGEH